MQSIEISIIIAIVLIIAFLLIIKAAEFFVQFSNDTRYIMSEVHRAYNDEEYAYWSRELRCHYLCLIPFVNEKNVSRLYDLIFQKLKKR